MQFICRFVDPKIQVLSIEVGEVKEGQFKPIESVKDYLSSVAPSTCNIVRFDDILGTQAYIKFSDFDDFFQSLINDTILSEYSMTHSTSFEDVMSHVKLSFYPMMIVIDIEDYYIYSSSSNS